MSQTRGFITIATGREEYYILANNLLHSYRHFCGEKLPFAILADRENEYTEEFDDVLIFRNGATNSYLDKLNMADYLPYDINIFIDSDCLAYGDLNRLFTYFEEADDFSCFGRVLPLDDTTGWFEYKNLGELQDKVSYVVGLHGGIYFMRRGETVCRILKTAKDLIPQYQKFHFKGKFATPGDEPLVALSMALNGCKPIPFIDDAITCYWEYEGRMDLDISVGRAVFTNTSEVNTNLVHWGTRFTRELFYQRETSVLKLMEQDKACEIPKCRRYYGRKMMCNRLKRLSIRVKNKVLRILQGKK